MAVEIAHDNDVAVLVDDIADVIELAEARTPSQRHVQDQHHQRVVAVAVADEQRPAPGDAAGQAVLDDLRGMEATQHPGAVLCESPDAAVGLVGPERHVRLFTEILGEVYVTAAQAAGIELLQTDNVVVFYQPGNTIEVAKALRMRQHVFPAARDVMPVASSTDTGLHVVAEQANALSHHGFLAGRRVAIRGLCHR